MAHAPQLLGPLGRRRRPLVDPRDGDIENDESSPERRSLLALAGNLLAEVSLPKMAAALVLLVVLPAVLLGLAPLIVSMWVHKLSSATSAYGIGAFVLLAVLVAVAWFGGRPLLRIMENSFWSLNAMAIQPGYVAWREVFMHLGQRVVGADASEAKRARNRAVASALSGVVICALALWVLVLAWPWTRWTGTLGDLRTPHWLWVAALANAVVLSAGYLAVAALVWGLADATMDQPRELREFTPQRELVRSWRVAHLSDIHVVGERYGFRLGSGRAGPQGNDQVIEVLKRLDELHRREPLDVILITGDLTDAGTSAEFAELLDALEGFPRLTDLIVALPGNHDLNVVDRANPARFDLPTSPKKRLRQIRTVSALAAMQGGRARVVDAAHRRLGDTVNDALEPSAGDMAAFADRGSRRLARSTDEAWVSIFPTVIQPQREDGLGIIALNSNAEAHFSFTNALGLVSVEQAHAIEAATRQFPRAFWIVALLHHIVEHPKLGHALAERIGTTLINGNWLTRRLQRLADRAVVMHGHRHIDWIGRCGQLLIVSAPSPVMSKSDSDDLYFYVHTVGVDASGCIALAEPTRVSLGRP